MLKVVIFSFSSFQAKDGLVVLFKKFDDGRAVYEGDIGKDALLEFIQRYAVPLVRMQLYRFSSLFKGVTFQKYLNVNSKTSNSKYRFTR